MNIAATRAACFDVGAFLLLRVFFSFHRCVSRTDTQNMQSVLLLVVVFTTLHGWRDQSAVLCGHKQRCHIDMVCDGIMYKRGERRPDHRPLHDFIYCSVLRYNAAAVYRYTYSTRTAAVQMCFFIRSTLKPASSVGISKSGSD